MINMEVDYVSVAEQVDANLGIEIGACVQNQRNLTKKMLNEVEKDYSDCPPINLAIKRQSKIPVSVNIR